MKKVGGTRASSARASVTAPREPWRKWVLTLLALGFALLVITLLMKQNKMLLTKLQSDEDAVLASGESQVSQDQEREKSSTQQVRSGECGENVGECLTYVDGAYYPQGLGVVEGYYEAYETVDWDGNKVICNAFIITDGSASLLEGFGKLADSGSGYIPRIADKQFRVNIDFQDTVANMTDEEVAAIVASTQDDQAEMQVFVYQPREGGVGTCGSPFAVLEVE